MKIVILLLSLFTTGFFCSCVKAKKNVIDYFPKVKTVSATVDGSGAVIVVGDIDLSGDSVFYVGFCLDTLPDPEITKNEKAYRSPTARMFSITYPNRTNIFNYEYFRQFKTYYFRTWAVNKYGYIYGNTIALSDIH